MKDGLIPRVLSDATCLRFGDVVAVCVHVDTSRTQHLTSMHCFSPTIHLHLQPPTANRRNSNEPIVKVINKTNIFALLVYESILETTYQNGCIIQHMGFKPVFCLWGTSLSSFLFLRTCWGCGDWQKPQTFRPLYIFCPQFGQVFFWDPPGISKTKNTNTIQKQTMQNNIIQYKHKHN